MGASPTAHAQGKSFSEFAASAANFGAAISIMDACLSPHQK
jgi:hypothetical protein